MAKTKNGGVSKHKQRRRTEPDRLAEVTFDPGARKEYLTGFHKRKVEKQKKSRLYHEQKEKEERKEFRKIKKTKSDALVKDELSRIEALNRSVSSGRKKANGGTGKEVRTIKGPGKSVTVTITHDDDALGGIDDASDGMDSDDDDAAAT